ncbi:MAG: MerR family transcriptional regulator [Acidimicrobiales bacterium]|nr:MerR family transcriptional regulator [Acidimicrobiales bacterium]MCB9371413.1 MerR family transcriptional regulator [Microthrixaceae bacterium]
MSERSHLSIGEVLSLLQAEFPDVTISKIRFLESQGLLDPERTPSGYRKFYEPDVERLRWILQQQRENFLPLKVIKGRLDEAGDHAVPAEPPRLAAVSPLAAPPEAPAAADAGTGALDAGPTSVSMTADELAQATGLSLDVLSDLERYGLLTGRAVGPTVLYDHDALLAAQVAAAFLRHGIEPRHLRMYKVAADREAGFLEQIVTPVLKQRNPAARRQALDTLEELTALGQTLRASLLREALRNLVGP